MRVTILPDRETSEIDAPTVGALLRELNFHQDAYLVLRGEEILTGDVRLAASDELEIWPVISGGGR